MPFGGYAGGGSDGYFWISRNRWIVTLRIFRTNLHRRLCLLLMWLPTAASLYCQTGSPVPRTRQPVSDGASKFEIVRRTVLPGDDVATTLAFDPVSRYLYVGRASRITILNADSGNTTGEIPNTGVISALLLIPELGRVFAATTSNTLLVFDLTSLHKIAALPIPGQAPNHLAYDPSSKRVFVMNNRSQSVVAVTADHPSVLGTIPLVDDPETAVTDASGHLYVVLADPAEIAVIDTSRLTLLRRIRLSPCNEPRGITLDVEARRLFVGCSNSFLAIADPDRAQLVSRLSIEPNSPEVSFDSKSQLVFAANPAGMISIVSQRFPDRYRLLSSLKTSQSIAAMAVDPYRHHLLVAVTGKTRTAADSSSDRFSPNMILTIGKSDARPMP